MNENYDLSQMLCWNLQICTWYMYLSYLHMICKWIRLINLYNVIWHNLQIEDIMIIKEISALFFCLLSWNDFFFQFLCWSLRNFTHVLVLYEKFIWHNLQIEDLMIVKKMSALFFSSCAEVQTRSSFVWKIDNLSWHIIFFV